MLNAINNLEWSRKTLKNKWFMEVEVFVISVVLILVLLEIYTVLRII